MKKTSYSICQNLPDCTRSIAKVSESSGWNVNYLLDVALNPPCLAGVGNCPSQGSYSSVITRSRDGNFFIYRENLSRSGLPRCVELAFRRSTTWEKKYFPARHMQRRIFSPPPNRIDDMLSRPLPPLEHRYQRTNNKFSQPLVL